MFAKKRTPKYEMVASDMKALHGRHARLGNRSGANSRLADMPELADGAGAYAAYDICEQRMTAEDAQVAYRKVQPMACSDQAGFAVRQAFEPAPPRANAAPRSDQDFVSVSELESKFEEFFRMGAVVAIGELFDEGLLGSKNAAAGDVRSYLESFGVASLADVQALGVSGPYLQDFERIFGASASFPPAA